MAGQRKRTTNSSNSGSRGRSASRNTSTKGRASANRNGSRVPQKDNEPLDYALRSEITVIVLLAVMVFLFLCNFGICGAVGSVMANIMFGLFGLLAYVAPIIIFFSAVFYISNFGSAAAVRKIISGNALAVMFGMLAEVISGRLQTYEGYDIVAIFNGAAGSRNGGGAIAGSLAYLCYHTLSMAGMIILIIVLGTVSIVILTERSVIGTIKKGSANVAEKAEADAAIYREQLEERRLRSEERKNKLREQKQLMMEERENDRILRMEAKENSKPLIPPDLKSGSKDESSEKSTDKSATGIADSSSSNLSVSSNKEEGTKDDNIFAPAFDEDIHDDIHEITINGKVFENTKKAEPIPDEKETGHERLLAAEPRITPYMGGQEEKPVPLPVPGAELDSSFDQDKEIAPIEKEPSNLDDKDFTELEAFANEAAKDTRPVARAASTEDEFSDEELSEISVHRENSEVNDGYTVHTQDHISPSKSKQQILGQPDPLPSHNDAAAKESSEIKKKPVPTKKYVFPPIDLLKPGVKNKNTDSERELKETALKLERTLTSFGVNVKVTDISQGPTVTRYELQPEIGVKVSRIVNLADDIKMNLAATDIRIEAPIPGKAAVGIEVPNKEIATVSFRDLIESPEYKNFKSKLAFAVGKDIGGKTLVTDIAKMPHVLIAGATGSGKSVCINTLILSIIYKAKPEEVGLIMIDPKVVELSVYNGIPHLVIPVVTDPKKAAAALNWAVKEMTVRYKKFADAGVRDLKGYNEYVEFNKDEDDSLIKMPQIVIIVDELADLMMVSASEVEEAICRLAQLARAAGIHLVIATQRPSVDVITGLIKANMPSRIAFAVSSGTDSRTIIDMNGAEKLLGKGDMLFDPQDAPKPIRVQGAFVSDGEIQKITDFLKAQNVTTDYNTDIQDDIKNIQSMDSSDSGAGQDSSYDEYFVEAGKFIIGKEKASIGMLQRVFKIGFNRAARIMDQLNEAGVVSEEEGTKPRKVLMSIEEFEQTFESSDE